jgi:type II secretory pathway component PulF
MDLYGRKAGLLFTILGFFWVVVGAAVLLFFVARLAGLYLLLLLALVYGWVLFAFVSYRQGRQDELLQLLITAGEAKAPLAPALRAYVHDRPAGPLREFWVGALLFLLLPGYYWLWYRRHRYDRKLQDVARLLEMGHPLHSALRAVPGAAPRQLILAAAVGQATGQLALCLHNAAQPRLAALWFEFLPRLIYPLLLLFFVKGILVFWMIFLVPKLVSIFKEFGAEPPDWTEHLIEFAHWLGEYWWVVLLALLALGIGVIGLIVSPTFRFWFPFVGGYYRRTVQSAVLKMLAALLEAQTPVPQALTLLAHSGSFPPVVRKRLETVRDRVEQGEPLADSLRRGGLLPRTMVPLVQAAERVGNLPWALAELADTIALGVIRRLRRMSVVLAALLLIALGGLVAFMALGMFLPLVDLMSRLSE